MKKIVLMSILTLFGTIHSGLACEMTVRVPEGDIYAPFFMKNENGIWDGLSIELVEALLEETGCTPIYKELPFSRGIEHLKNGKIEIMLNMTITEERKTFTYFIGPQVDETVVLVVPKESSFEITSMDDLKKLPSYIGIEAGKVYGKTFEKKRRSDADLERKLDTVYEVNLNENKLKARRISGFLGFGYNVYYRIKTDPSYSGLKVHPFVINQDWVYFGFSKKSVSLNQLKKLQDAYNRATKKGVFEAIRNRYRID